MNWQQRMETVLAGSPERCGDCVHARIAAGLILHELGAELSETETKQARQALSQEMTLDKCPLGRLEPATSVAAALCRYGFEPGSWPEAVGQSSAA